MNGWLKALPDDNHPTNHHAIQQWERNGDVENIIYSPNWILRTWHYGIRSISSSKCSSPSECPLSYQSFGWLAAGWLGLKLQRLPAPFPSEWVSYRSQWMAEMIVINVVKIQMSLEFGSTFNNPISPFPKDDIPPIYCYTNDTIYIQCGHGDRHLVWHRPPSIHRSRDFRKATDQCWPHSQVNFNWFFFVSAESWESPTNGRDETRRRTGDRNWALKCSATQVV